MEFQKNVLLKYYTTYKIGGPAKYFFVAKNKEDLILAIKKTKELKLPVFVLGGGSNILVADKGFKGLVIKISNNKFELLKSNRVYAGAGLSLTKLAHLLSDNGFTGMEWSVGIPNATVGGAIFGHAQAFGSKMSDFIEFVEVLDLKNLKIKNLSKNQCKFSLKNSIFKKNKNLVIISAVFKFKKGDKIKIKEKMQNTVYHRNTKHPMAFASAGSTFVNPEVIIKNKKLLKLYPELVDFNKNKAIPAGYLVEKCGLTGKKVGKAQISPKHSNFIINTGGAKAKDVMALIKLAKTKVKKTFGINLETEVQLLGFNS